MLDEYQRYELEPSACQQLDVAGMQPHAREYLEYELNCGRMGYMYGDDYSHEYGTFAGLQFTGKP